MPFSADCSIMSGMAGSKKAHTGGAGSSLLAKGASLSFLTLCSRVLGLLREMTKAHLLGTSAYSDAFGIAFMIPNLFRRLFAENSVSVAFIPTFKGYLEDSGEMQLKRTAEEFVGATFTVVLSLTACVAALGMIFAPQVLRLFYADEASIGEAVLLTRMMFPYLVVISVAALYQGILNSLRIFSPSGFTPVLFNAAVIASAWALGRVAGNPARAMAIGVIVGGIIQATFQLPFVVKQGWRPHLVPLPRAFANAGCRKVFALVGPTIIGMAGYQINDVVSSALATRAGEGVVSSLQYSLRLQELILGICAVTVGTVILPDLTGFAKRQDWGGFNTLLTGAIKAMVLICLPVTFYSLAMGESLIALVFSGGAFREESVALTNSVFRLHIAGLLFIATNRIVSPAFYAQSDTKHPTAAGLINFAVNIALASLLCRRWGGRGIAFALSVASAANTVALFIFLGRGKGGQVAGVVGTSLLYALKLALLSVIAAVPVLLLRGPLVSAFAGHGKLIAHGMPVLITGVIFCAVGVLLLAALHDPVLHLLLAKIVRRK